MVGEDDRYTEGAARPERQPPALERVVDVRDVELGYHLLGLGGEGEAELPAGVADGEAG